MQEKFCLSFFVAVVLFQRLFIFWFGVVFLKSDQLTDCCHMRYFPKEIKLVAGISFV